MNGLLSAVPGGVISAEVNSVATDGTLTLDAHKIGTSIYEMGFVGGVLGAVSAASGKFVKSGEPSLRVQAESEPPVASYQHIAESNGLFNTVISTSLLGPPQHFSSLDVAFEGTAATGSKLADSPSSEIEHKYALGDWHHEGKKVAVDDQDPSTTKGQLFFPGGFSNHEFAHEMFHQAALEIVKEEPYGLIAHGAHGMGAHGMGAHGMGAHDMGGHGMSSHHMGAHEASYEVDPPISGSLFGSNVGSKAFSGFMNLKDAAEFMDNQVKGLKTPKVSVVTVDGTDDAHLKVEGLSGKLAPHVKGTDVDAAVALWEKHSLTTFGHPGVEKASDVSKSKVESDNSTAAPKPKLNIDNPTGPAKFSGLYPNLDAMSRVLVEHLPARRFRQVSEAKSGLEKVEPETDWQNRADQISEAVARRMNSVQLSKDAFDSFREMYGSEDRPIVDRLMDLAAGNSTDYGLKRSIMSVAKQMNDSGDFTANGSSFWAARSFLVRKCSRLLDEKIHFGRAGNQLFNRLQD